MKHLPARHQRINTDVNALIGQEEYAMDYHTYYAKADRPVETCIVGTGSFGQSFLAQAQRVPLMNARIAVDISAETAAAGLKAAGIDPERIQSATLPPMQKPPGTAATSSPRATSPLWPNFPIDVVRRSDGQPIAAARHALIAIEARKHLALVTKELDSVVGPGSRLWRRTGPDRHHRGRRPTEPAHRSCHLGRGHGLSTSSPLENPASTILCSIPSTGRLTSNERSATMRPCPSLGSGRARRRETSSPPAPQPSRFPAARRAGPVRAHGGRERNWPAAGPHGPPRTPCAHQRGADDLLPP